MNVRDLTEKVVTSVKTASGFSKKCFIILSLFLSATLFAATAPYGTTELTFTGESHANPYTEVDFEATFTGPDGTTMTVPGFWDGGNTWKIRFAPTKIGTWSYVTHATNDSLLDNKTGSIECSGTKEKGWMIVDPNHPKHFEWSGSEEPYLLLGDCWWGHLSDSTNGDGKNFPYTKFTQLVDEWSQAGYSYAYCMLASWNPSSIAWYNEGERPYVLQGNMFDLNRPNPAYFQKVDARIAYANSKGICIALDLTESKNQVSDINIYKRLGKYVLARWAGANISIWLVSEYNDTEGEPFTVADWDAIGDYLQTKNPYNHPISLHCLGWEASGATPSGSTMEDFKNKAWHDYVVQQGTPADGDESYSTRKIVSQINKPFISSEFYMGWSSWTQTPEWEMQHCWEVLMGGGYFCTGHAKVAYVNYYGWNGAETQSVTFNNYLSIMRDFFTKKSVNFNKRVAANYLIPSGTGYAYRIGDDEFVIYKTSKGSIDLDLNDISGTFGVTAVNLRTGAEAELPSVDGGSTVSLSTPDYGYEWILRVYRTSASAVTIIVDNNDSDYSESTGWSSSTSTAGYYGSDYRYDGTSGADTEKWAKWAPAISESGNYNVYMRWPSYSNRPDQAPLEIKYNGGIDTSKAVDQTKNGGDWVFIGKYEFVAGADNYVKIMASDTGYTIADAVKFEYDSPSATIPTEIASPSAATTFAPGETVTATGTGDNLSWSIDRLNDGVGPIATGSGSSIEFTIPADSTESQDIVITLTGDAGTVSQTHNIVIQTATNQAPVVNAGTDQTITLPASASLNATVTDDGLPTAYTVQWSEVSGPENGTVNFADANAEATTVSFSQDGTYVLRLTADDTELQTSSDVTIVVNPEPVNHPTGDPVVYEAEAMTLNNYEVNASTTASGGELIKLLSTSGTASCTFNGASGLYNLAITAIDENDGQGSLEVRINGSLVGVAVLNRDTDSGALDTFETFDIASGITINNGDNVEITGYRNVGEYARVDYITFTPVDAGETKLNISGLTLSGYEVVDSGLTVGATQYIDRDYTFTSVPLFLEGQTYIKTANDDKVVQGNNFLVFDVNKAVTVYVAYDEGYTTKPAWLDDFTDTGETIEGSLNGNGIFRIYSKTFPAGTVVLGGNSPDGTGFSMYTVVIVESKLNISGLNPAEYELLDSGLTVGATQYIDRDYTFDSVPAFLEGQTYIKTANDDKLVQGDNFLVFDVNKAVTVYVAHDDRYTVKPAWLDDFTDTGEDLTSGSPFSLFSKTFPAGTVVLGGNSPDGSGSSVSMYTVVIVEKLKISNPTPSNYEVVDSGLTVGTKQYIDRDYTFDSVPAFLEGQTYIKTANDDKAVQGDNFLIFDVNKPVTVYVAYDDRYTVKPAWLDDFTDTGEDLTSGGLFSLFSKTFPAGTVVLGGNSPDGTGFSMYTVVVVPQ